MKKSSILIFLLFIGIAACDVAEQEIVEREGDVLEEKESKLSEIDLDIIHYFSRYLCSLLLHII